MAYLKPQSPLQHKDGDYFYPLTTVDQVVMPDGSRLNSVFKHTVKKEVILLASDWSNTTPYTQIITVDEYVDDLQVDANIIYSGDLSVDDGLNKAASCLSYIKKNGDEITFYCLKSQPEIDIPIEISYESLNGIATIGTSEEIDLDEELAAQAELIEELQEALQGKMGKGVLDFSIVGGANQPTNPVENTIWIQTDDEENIVIENWYFGADEPETPENGMVWIFTGDYSTTQINALKKNDIHLYLILAKQYISGEWVEKPTKLYTQDGWTSLWDGTIYDNGTFYESITGEWGRWVGNITGNFYKNSDSMVVSCAGSKSTRCYVSHDKPVDLTNFNTLTVDNTCSTKGYNRSHFEVVDESGTTVATIYFYHGVRQKGKCDISKLSGKYYFRWGVVFSENGATYSATVYEIKLS